ncbi:MAG: GNAT family N-acetyltransferase [Acidobacteriota bacterium]
MSLSLVTDPFANFDPEWLRRHFDVFAAFKEHFVADLTQPIEGFVSKSHRSAVRRALQKVDVEWCAEPATYLDVWVELFGHLMRRHNISGVRAFSREGFARQLRTPGLVMFKALFQGEIVGLDLWYVHGDVAYGHLVAMSPEGYRLRASYALKWYLLHYFAEKVHWLDFGGGAGTEAAGNDGLSRFKEGWSTGTRTVYFCGRILNRERYCELAEAKGDVGGRYFPVYREGEFD